MVNLDKQFWITAYVKDVLGHDLLTREQEVALGKRILSGDKAAIDELAVSNLRFVVHMAKHINWINVPIEDRVSDGNVGVLVAAERYDYRMEVRFASYAMYWIRAYILNGARVMEKAVVVRADTGLNLRPAKRFIEKLWREKRRHADVDDLMEGMGLSETQAISIFVMLGNTVSLDDYVNKDGTGMTKGDLIVSKEDSTGFLGEQSIAAKSLSRIMKSLSLRSIDIIKMRSGITPYEEEHTLHTL